MDNGIAPEAATILADAPPFCLIASLGGGLCEQGTRHAIRLIFMAKEAGKVLSDDLVAGVALDPLRATIPGRHEALGVEHIDGVIGDCID